MAENNLLGATSKKVKEGHDTSDKNIAKNKGASKKRSSAAGANDSQPDGNPKKE